MSTVSGPSTPAQSLKPEERLEASSYLNLTRDNVLAAVSDLSSAQWNFKPASDRWAILEIVEHLILIEERICVLLQSMPEAPISGPAKNSSEVDDFVLAEVPRRTTKIQAPPAFMPTQGLSADEAVARFIEVRSRTFSARPFRPASCFRSLGWLSVDRCHGGAHRETYRADSRIESPSCFPEHTQLEA
jgi:DinB superfamily